MGFRGVAGSNPDVLILVSLCRVQISVCKAALIKRPFFGDVCGVDEEIMKATRAGLSTLCCS